MKTRLVGWLVLAVCLAICGGCDSDSLPSALPSMVYLATEPPDQLNPLLTSNESSRIICELIFDGLVNKTTMLSGREQLQWALVAEDGYLEQDPTNALLLTICLRKDVLWHDGTPLIAADVLYTLEAIRQSTSPLSGWLNRFIRAVEPVPENNYKFRLHLKTERSKEAFKELFAPIKILPHSYEYRGERRRLPYDLASSSELADQFKWYPIGTGPYKILEKQSQTKFTLAANEDVKRIPARPYYMRTGAAIPGLVVPRLAVDAGLAGALRIRELRERENCIDLDVQPSHFNALQGSPLASQIYMPNAFHALIYNSGRAPCSDPSFRKALTCATDKRSLATAFLVGFERWVDQAVNSGIFPSSSGYVQASPGSFHDTLPFDQMRASSYLRQASVGSKAVVLLLCSAVDGDQAAHLADSYKSMLQRIGVSVEVSDCSSPVYLDRLRRRDFDVALYQFKGFDQFYDFRPYFGSGEWNYWQVQDSSLHGMLTEFASSLKWKERLSLAASIHARVQELAPACFLFSVPRCAYFSNRLKNVSIHPEVGFATIEQWEWN